MDGWVATYEDFLGADIVEEVAQFELEVETQGICCNDDVVEAIEENYYGALNDKKVDPVDPVRKLVIEEKGKNISEVQSIYKVSVPINDIAIETIENWNLRYEFDDLAFANAVYDEVKIKIKKVNRIK